MYGIGEATVSLISLATVWSGALNAGYFFHLRPRRPGTLLRALLFGFVAAQAAVYGWLYPLAAGSGFLFHLELAAAAPSLLTTLLSGPQENDNPTHSGGEAMQCNPKGMRPIPGAPWPSLRRWLYGLGFRLLRRALPAGEWARRVSPRAGKGEAT